LSVSHSLPLPFSFFFLLILPPSRSTLFPHDALPIYYKKPVILTDYPREIKSFYMKQNAPDEQGRHTVRAMDILFPGIGEMVGGSQREENLEKLLTRMAEVGIPEEEMDWFLDTRRFGSAPHSGFGVGFERLVLFV